MTPKRPQPEIADFGLIGDRRGLALVSRRGSIDWCCLPRMDSGALFARLLDHESGGHFSVELPGSEAERRYLDRSLVLETRFACEEGEARLLDFFARPEEGRGPTIVRVLEGMRGSCEFEVAFAPRFDYGAVDPWLRGAEGVFTAIGGNDGVLLRSEANLDFDGRHRLAGTGRLKEGERVRMTATFRHPVELDDIEAFEPLDPESVDACLEQTVEWWREWSACVDTEEGAHGEALTRSALTLKALSFEPTGSIAAAATTSLPEARRLSGERNWDYRYSWVRDSALAVRSLAEVGCARDADAFRHFIERSAAGNAHDLQVVFGIGGERRLGETEVDALAGWRGAAPVRVGNQASGQLQLDAFGQLLEQSWSWHLRGNSPEPDYWHFLADLVEAAGRHWREPDRGIWEWRGEPLHFVHSKVLAWAALNRGIQLAEDSDYDVPASWPETRDEIRTAVESEGYDRERGVFVQAFGRTDMDAALLRMPVTGFLPWDDERMIRTADEIRERLSLDGLLRRYEADDGMPEEGAFLACSFWLASCLARQGREPEARETFDAAAATANDLGLFAEEYDPEAPRMLGNFPQALTHLSHIEAALSLARSDRDREA